MSKARILLLSVLASTALTIVIALKSDPSPIMVFRGYDGEPLSKGMPDTTGGGFRKFKAMKFYPLENYHSGGGNNSMYLFGKSRARFRFEFVSSDRALDTLSLVFLVNYRFISPILLSHRDIRPVNDHFRFPVAPSVPFQCDFEVEEIPEGTSQLSLVVVDSKGFAQNPFPYTILQDAFLYHVNLHRGSFRETSASYLIAKETSALDRKEGRSYCMVKGNSLAIMNKDRENNRFVICQPGSEPVLVEAAYGSASIFTGAIRDPSLPMLVIEKPFWRNESKFGLALGVPLLAFFDYTMPK
jgi:hypothetical protein